MSGSGSMLAGPVADLNDPTTMWHYKLHLLAVWLDARHLDDWLSNHGYDVAAGGPVICMTTSGPLWRDVFAAAKRVATQTGDRRGQWGADEALLLNPCNGAESERLHLVDGLMQPTQQELCATVWATTGGDSWSGWGATEASRMVLPPEYLPGGALHDTAKNYFSGYLNAACCSGNDCVTGVLVPYRGGVASGQSSSASTAAASSSSSGWLWATAIAATGAGAWWLWRARR